MLDDIVIVGLMGGPCTGKTATAQVLAPVARTTGQLEDPTWFQHIFFAMPLYEIVNVKKKIEGPDATDRQAYEIHRILSEMWPSPIYGGPPYGELVDIVRKTVAWRLPEDEKPRDFMQWLGTDVCRAIDPDCFVNLVRRRMTNEYHIWRRDADPKQMFGVIISDVRFPNEVDFIRQYPRSLLAKLECDEGVRNERAEARDGIALTDDQAAHASESGLVDIDPDVTIDTTYLTIPDQANQIKGALQERFIG